MPTYCPFCAAPLAPTDDAFCGECRGQLDEAPPPGSTQADIELRRKISTGASGDMTPIDLIVCVAFPAIGLILGAVRKAQDRPSADGILRWSCAMLVVRFVLGSIVQFALR